MSFSLNVVEDSISPALTRLVETARNPAPVVRAMGTTFYSIVKGNFEGDTSYRPATWKPKYQGGPSRLRKSNTLFNSIFLRSEARQAIVGTPMVYAAIHQFGGIIKPKKGDFLVFSAADGAPIFASEVKIPPRPFFPIKDGKLTAKAEEKILRAGQRVIEKQ